MTKPIVNDPRANNIIIPIGITALIVIALYLFASFVNRNIVYVPVSNHYVWGTLDPVRDKKRVMAKIRSNNSDFNSIKINLGQTDDNTFSNIKKCLSIEKSYYIDTSSNETKEIMYALDKIIDLDEHNCR